MIEIPLQSKLSALLSRLTGESAEGGSESTCVRVSSREQAEGGYSIEAQLEACRRLVTEKGWLVEDEFTESGESGRTLNRPAFKAMVAMLDEHQGISHLVIHKIDRLARNLADYAAVKAQLKKLGIRLVSVTEGLEESPSGRLVEGIMATIAEFIRTTSARKFARVCSRSCATADGPTWLRSVTSTSAPTASANPKP